MKIPQIALVGVGGYGKVHFDYLKSLAGEGKIRLAAAVILPECAESAMPVADELRMMGTAIYPSDDALLAGMGDGLDLVCLPVGIGAHCAMTCKFLAAGINVLLEKPAAGSVGDVLRMIEAEKQSGKFVAVGFNNIYGEDIHAVKREILSGRYGKLKNISFKGGWRRSDRYYRRNSWAGKLWAADGTAVLDSPLNNAFAHYLNIALFCAGPEFRTAAHASAMQAELVRARDTIETFDTCGVRILTGQGGSIHALATHACEEDCEPRMRFDLESARIHWDSGVGRWYILDFAGQCTRVETLPDSRKSMFESVLARLNDPMTFICTLSQALEHTFCIEQMHELFPIRELREDEYREVIDFYSFRVIPGILDIFDEGFRKNLLPSEAGALWSFATPMIQLDYADAASQ